MIPPKIIFAFFSFINLIGCKPNSPGTGKYNFKVDTNIRSAAHQHTRTDNGTKSAFSFTTRAVANFYTNDSLERLNVDTINLRMWARYSWQSDTVVLKGYAPVLLSGFSAKIVQGSLVEFQHNRCGRSTHLFRRNEKAGFNQCIEVDCEQVELIISAVPDSNRNSGVFGYVNFKSERYDLRSNSQVGKAWAEMRFYFIAYNYHYYLRKLGVDKESELF